MRRTRWLLLSAILAILGGIGALYQAQKRSLETQAPAKPAVLPSQISGLRDDFQWTRSDAGQAKSEISAHKVSQQKDSSQVHLEQVALKIYNKTGDKYDLVKSATADFDQNASRMFAEGEVVITLSVPVDGKPTRQLVEIQSSGVTFDVKTGQEFVTTDRPTHFTFENGTGECVGASYDPTKRELTLRQNGEIDWKAPTPHAPPLKIEAGEVVYKEAEGTVWLNGWARLTRQNTVVNAASSVVHLQDNAIRQVDALKAQGTDSYPKRKLEYAADELHVTYNDQGEVEHISGRNNARLVSSSAGSETAMTSDVVDLDIETVNGESVLKRALGNGHAMIVSKPVSTPDGKPPETHVVHSDVIEVKMRSGGREVETVQTHAPGRLDFLPNQPSQHPRRLDAERMTMIYGPSNQLESFRAVSVQTQTEPSAEELAKKKQDVSKTRSRNLSARFDPKTGQMKHMEQWDDFLYEDGDRKATANRATLEQDSNLMSLETGARVWDATGTTSADRILIDQKTGDFTAEGHVSSSRMPDKKTSPSGMLAGDEPMEAMAARMTSANHNHLLHYEGHVLMWQGADRISADRTDVDRDKRMVRASGNVVTQFREKTKQEGDAPAIGTTTAPTFVVVKAANLAYTDQDRLAHYTGGVVLKRPLLEVDADDLRAVLAPQNNDKTEKKDNQKKDDDEEQSRLEKAYADGHVKIVQAATDRTRTGTSDHAEYFTDNERIVLTGGQPQMLDSRKGFIRGAELTYYVNDDRLLVSGSPQQRATGRLRRKQ
jgi:lipopolysaccharide export system protein LptA